MIALQEELDWHCYFIYGLLEEDLSISPRQVPALKLGERAFEIRLVRNGEETTWFERHRSTPITELPADWPETYRELVERRIATIELDRNIALIERPEYKRRWNLSTWEEMESAALKSWLLDRIEANAIWKDRTLVSCAQLRDALARDADWLSVAEIYLGGPLEEFDKFVIDLATPEAVPFLSVLRYTETGLRKRAEWEQVWKLQREEDAGTKAEIPVPPKYSSKDFQKTDYWRLRGGLDVSKERFILYQGLQRDSDETPVLGWAGWSHLEQARALAAYYQRMRTEEGWEPERLKPVLAGLLDLREWLKQWHDDLDPETGLKLGTYFSEFAEAQCQELGFSPQEVFAWQPPARARRAARKRAKQNDRHCATYSICPERVNPGDFVLKLSDVVDHPDAALKDYVVTDQLARCFDDAMGLVESAITSHESKATYLHGSFGAGKSHFMAVLYLLLARQRCGAVAGKARPGRHQAQPLDAREEISAGAVSHDRRGNGGAAAARRLLRSGEQASSGSPPAGLFPSDALMENALTLRANGRGCSSRP